MLSSAKGSFYHSARAETSNFSPSQTDCEGICGLSANLCDLPARNRFLPLDTKVARSPRSREGRTASESIAFARQVSVGREERPKKMPKQSPKVVLELRASPSVGILAHTEFS